MTSLRTGKGRAVAEGTVGIPLDVVIRPKLSVRTSGSDLILAPAYSVEKERSAPAINELVLRVQSTARVGQKTLPGRVHTAQGSRPVLIGAKGTICGGLDQEREIVDQLRHEGQVVFGWLARVGVVAQDRASNGFAALGFNRKGDLPQGRGWRGLRFAGKCPGMDDWLRFTQE